MSAKRVRTGKYGEVAEVVIDGDLFVEFVGEGTDDDPVRGVVKLGDGPDSVDLDEYIEEHFGYAQESSLCSYGPLRLTIERLYEQS